MRRALFLFIIIISCCSETNAEPFEMFGIGIQSCGYFASQYKNAPELIENSFFYWAQGMMTGMNLASRANGGIAKDLSAKSVGDQTAFIRSYCDEHPLAQYWKAVADLYFSFPNAPDRK